MRNICFAAAWLFCLQVYGAKAESMDSQTTYLNYKVATSNGQGSRRCPANLAFLPSTWMDDGWTMDGRWRRRVRRALSHVGLNYKEFRYEKRWISI